MDVDEMRNLDRIRDHQCNLGLLHFRHDAWYLFHNDREHNGSKPDGGLGKYCGTYKYSWWLCYTNDDDNIDNELLPRICLLESGTLGILE